jgi:hypothetical protein
MGLLDISILILAIINDERFLKCLLLILFTIIYLITILLCNPFNKKFVYRLEIFLTVIVLITYQIGLFIT